MQKQKISLRHRIEYFFFTAFVLLVRLSPLCLAKVNKRLLYALAKGVEYAGIARVIYPQIWLKDVLNANGVVLILGLLVSLYPAVKAARFLPVQALAHN